jgi:alpha-tubulin suppressor-like RCC1 family protein
MKTSACPILLVLALTSACGASHGPSGRDHEATGQVRLAVTVVPASVQCIQVVASGSTTVSQEFPTMSGQSSAQLSLGELPLGSVSITGTAFDVACGSIATASPAYVADPQAVNLEAGVVTNITMTFRPDNPVTANANFVGNVVDVRSSYAATYIVLSDGTVRQSGNSYLTNSQTFVPIPGLTNVVQIAVGWWSACAVISGGTVQCWGAGESGELGNGTTVAFSSTPVTVSNLSTVVQITAGLRHYCAVLSNGAVMCWGDNTYGELGNGTTTSSAFPVQAGVGNAAAIAAGSWSTCEVTSQGSVYCWGHNGYGELGNNTTTNSSTAVYAGQGAAVTALAGGAFHFCSVRADGAVKCWGQNIEGQVGNGTFTNSLVPVQVSIPLAALQLAATGAATCARTTAGVYCWGDDQLGELGDGKGMNQASPQLLGLGATTSIVGGPTGSSFFAVLANQTLDAWGNNNFGQLGTGTYTDAFLPTPIMVP